MNESFNSRFFLLSNGNYETTNDLHDIDALLIILCEYWINYKMVSYSLLAANSWRRQRRWWWWWWCSQDWKIEGKKRMCAKLLQHNKQMYSLSLSLTFTCSTRTTVEYFHCPRTQVTWSPPTWSLTKLNFLSYCLLHVASHSRRPWRLHSGFSLLSLSLSLSSSFLASLSPSDQPSKTWKKLPQLVAAFAGAPATLYIYSLSFYLFFADSQASSPIYRPGDTRMASLSTFISSSSSSFPHSVLFTFL